ncbi:MAG: site-specific integrase [Symbiopectobacterium sp.]
MQAQDRAHIEQFLEAMWLERNLSDNTLTSYRRDLTALADWLAHADSDLLQVQTLDLKAYLTERMEGGYKATSLTRLLSTMRRFSVFIPGKMTQ